MALDYFAHTAQSKRPAIRAANYTSPSKKRRAVAREIAPANQSDDDDLEVESEAPKGVSIDAMDIAGFGDFDNLERGLWAKCQVLDVDPVKTLKKSPGWELLRSYNILTLPLSYLCKHTCTACADAEDRYYKVKFTWARKGTHNVNRTLM